MRSGAARGTTGSFHEAGFYRCDEEFLALIVPFVLEGLVAREPVVVGYDARRCDLLRRALPQPDAVIYLVDEDVYASPARALEAYQRQIERHLMAGAQQIRLSGGVPHPGDGGRFEGWDRYESAVNAVWEDLPVWCRCLYDATTVPDEVRDVVERTHPLLVTPDGVQHTSPRYQEVGEFEPLRPAADPLEAAAPAVRLVGASLKKTRRRVAEVAAGTVDPTALDDLVFATSEAVINAQQHGAPPTTVTVWTAEDRVVVRVHDTGPGPADPLTGLVPAPRSSAGAGLGLWLSANLADVDVALVPAADGFTVRLRAGRLPEPGEAPDAGDANMAPVGAGTVAGEPPDRGSVHALDGDGSSYCDVVGAAGLVGLDACWSDVPGQQRCPECQLLLDSWGWRG